MVVQNQAELGEGSAILTDPHHTPTIILPLTQPQKTQKPRKPKRKDTQVPQHSGPTEHVADQAAYKELGDILVRAATTASSLEAEHDSGGGPRCQETMGDTIAQTRFENVSKLSNDSLLARANEIASLKRRVKKLKRKKRSRTYGLKRLRKVGATARVESSGNEEDLGEDTSKQGRRINAIDADEDITLVSVQDDVDKEMFDVDALDGEEVFVAEQNENVVEEVVDAAQVSTATTTVIITTEEITLAQALADLKSTKPKAKGIAFREPGESTTTIFSQQLQDKVEIDEEERIARAEEEKIDEAYIALTEEWDDIQDKIEADHELAKRVEEQRNKPSTQAQQRKIMCTYLKNMEGKKLKDLKNKSFDSIQKMFDRAFKRVNTFVDFRTDLVKDEEEVAIDAVHLATKPPTIFDWKIYKEGKKSYYQIVRADGKSQMYLVFSHMLKSFNKEDLEDLYKLVKARYGSTRPVEDLDLVLWNDLKNMFEPHVEDEIWKLQQSLEINEVFGKHPPGDYGTFNGET
ncbi:hypothetical protein Tco_0381878 [Tanacetum coccineum]